MRKFFKTIINKFRVKKTFAEMSETKMTPDFSESGVSSSEAETIEALDALAAEKAEFIYSLSSSSATLQVKPLTKVTHFFTPKNDLIYTDHHSDSDAEDEVCEGKGKEVVYRRPR